MTWLAVRVGGGVRLEARGLAAKPFDDGAHLSLGAPSNASASTAIAVSERSEKKAVAHTSALRLPWCAVETAYTTRDGPGAATSTSRSPAAAATVTSPAANPRPRQLFPLSPKRS